MLGASLELPSSAGELGPDGYEAGAAGACGRRALVTEIWNDHRRGRVKDKRGRGVALGERLILGRLDDGARDEVGRRAAGMQVEKRVAHREDIVRDIGRDVLGERAGRVARKCAVEIEPVDRRSAPRRRYSWGVDRRHKDEPALEPARIEIARKFTDDDRPFVFVAVVSPLDDHRGPRVSGDDGDRNAGYPPGVVMRRVWKHDKANLSAVFFEVDVGEGESGPLCMAFNHFKAFMAIRGLAALRVDGRIILRGSTRVNAAPVPRRLTLPPRGFLTLCPRESEELP